MRAILIAGVLVCASVGGSSLMARADHARVAPGGVSLHERSRHTIRSFLMRQGASTARANTVAGHILDQSARWKVDPALVTAIVSVENPTLAVRAESDKGAVGVMQVMPFWRARWSKVCGQNLREDRVNVCMGIQVLKMALHERHSLHGALLAYNGCRDLESPCQAYPRVVLKRRWWLLAEMGVQGS